MITFLIYTYIAIGLLLFIVYSVFYGSAMLISPFVNFYNAIKQKDKKMLFATMFFLVSCALLVFVIFI